MILPGKLDTLQSDALQGQVPEALTPSPSELTQARIDFRPTLLDMGGKGRQRRGEGAGHPRCPASTASYGPL